jgi:hypothetical protein
VAWGEGGDEPGEQDIQAAFDSRKGELHEFGTGTPNPRQQDNRGILVSTIGQPQPEEPAQARSEGWARSAAGWRWSPAAHAESVPPSATREHQPGQLRGVQVRPVRPDQVAGQGGSVPAQSGAAPVRRRDGADWTCELEESPRQSRAGEVSDEGGRPGRDRVPNLPRQQALYSQRCRGRMVGLLLWTLAARQGSGVFFFLDCMDCRPRAPGHKDCLLLGAECDLSRCYLAHHRFIAKVAINWTLGIIVVVIGTILALLGIADHAARDITTERYRPGAFRDTVLASARGRYEAAVTRPGTRAGRGSSMAWLFVPAARHGGCADDR